MREFLLYCSIYVLILHSLTCGYNIIHSEGCNAVGVCMLITSILLCLYVIQDIAKQLINIDIIKEDKKK